MGSFQTIILIIYLYLAYLFVPCGLAKDDTLYNTFCTPSGMVRLNGQVVTNSEPK